MAIDESENGLFFIKPPEVAFGRVVITPGASHPYKVVFRLGERVLSEHPVPTVREGEALIRRELAHIQFTTRQERPDPEAPHRRDHLSAVE
jgi:hypothetical protein